MRCAGTRTTRGVELNRVIKSHEVDGGNSGSRKLEREHTEAPLASEERYRTLSDCVPVAVYSSIPRVSFSSSTASRPPLKLGGHETYVAHKGQKRWPWLCSWAAISSDPWSCG